MAEEALDPQELGVATLDVDGYQYWLAGCDYPAEGVRKIWFERGPAGGGEGEIVFELTEALTGPGRVRAGHAEQTLELAADVLDGFLPDASDTVYAERQKINDRMLELTGQGVAHGNARRQARAEWLDAFLRG